MRVYVEVSKNHNIPIMDVIMNKFSPDIRLLLMYYNYRFMLEHKEYERMMREQEEIKREVNQ